MQNPKSRQVQKPKATPTPPPPPNPPPPARILHQSPLSLTLPSRGALAQLRTTIGSGSSRDPGHPEDHPSQWTEL